MTAHEIITALNLSPHPEGGHYRETWRAPSPDGLRASGTAILFLLAAGERSHWHKVDATEIWHYHAGAPLRLMQSPSDAGPAQAGVLGPDLSAGQSPQLIVPPDHWQAAESCGDWTLVGCTVSPGFDFAGFTLAPPGFTIPEA
ncbi:MAG: cupin domain-containing protein [Mangrovicoccus sp.]|nr:cupin domain-containing protein [Mangrovicoccus sp.]